MGLKVGEVKLEAYNYNWKEMFLKEKEELKKKFKDVALTIEHIGSTAVKGLSAKPIIDIAIGLDKLEDFNIVKENFIKDENYSIKEDFDAGEILIRKGNENNRTHFIHVMEISSERYKNAILFRNYLQKNIQALNAYEALKIELANRYSNNRKEYTKSKNMFINEIIIRAKKL